MSTLRLQLKKCYHTFECRACQLCSIRSLLLVYSGGKAKVMSQSGTIPLGASGIVIRAICSLRKRSCDTGRANKAFLV